MRYVYFLFLPISVYTFFFYDTLVKLHKQRFLYAWSVKSRFHSIFQKSSNKFLWAPIAWYFITQANGQQPSALLLVLHPLGPQPQPLSSTCNQLTRVSQLFFWKLILISFNYCLFYTSQIIFVFLLKMTFLSLH